MKYKGPNKKAYEYANRYAGSRIADIAKTTKAGVKAVIKRAIRTKLSPYDTAVLVSQTVGLDVRSSQAVMNYRDTLMKAGGRRSTIDRAVKRYADKKRFERATTIARTEVMDALNKGMLEEIRQGVRDGDIRESAKIEWVSADVKPCPLCSKMNGVRVKVGGSFQTPLGRVKGPILHPRCRCYIVLVVSK